MILVWSWSISIVVIVIWFGGWMVVFLLIMFVYVVWWDEILKSFDFLFFENMKSIYLFPVLSYYQGIVRKFIFSASVLLERDEKEEGFIG